MPRGVPKQVVQSSQSQPKDATPHAVEHKTAGGLEPMKCECGTVGSAFINKATGHGFCFKCGRVHFPTGSGPQTALVEKCPKCRGERISDLTPGGGSMYCGDCHHRWQRGAEALSMQPKAPPREIY